MQKHTKHNRHNNVLHFNASHMNLYWECKSSQGRSFCSSAKRSTLDIAGNVTMISPEIGFSTTTVKTSFLAQHQFQPKSVTFLGPYGPCFKMEEP